MIRSIPRAVNWRGESAPGAAGSAAHHDSYGTLRARHADVVYTSPNGRTAALGPIPQVRPMFCGYKPGVVRFLFRGKSHRRLLAFGVCTAKHDGQLYRSPEEYEPRAKRINQNPRARDAVVSGRRPEAGAEFSVDRCGWPSPFIREFNPRTVHVRLPRVRTWFSLWVIKRLG
jgi:hypothetical protein